MQMPEGLFCGTELHQVNDVLHKLNRRGFVQSD